MRKIFLAIFIFFSLFSFRVYAYGVEPAVCSCDGALVAGVPYEISPNVLYRDYGQEKWVIYKSECKSYGRLDSAYRWLSDVDTVTSRYDTFAESFTCVVDGCDENSTTDGFGNCIDNPPTCTLPDLLDSNNTCQPDFDNDGIPDTDDDDDDNDGYPDLEDAFPLDATEHVDSDNDGVGDNSDPFPHDANEWVDTDGDGIGDNQDFDNDGDGYSDTQEIADGTDPLDANDNSSTPSGCSSTCGVENAGICQDEISYGAVETPIAVVDYESCDTCSRITQEFYGMTCSQFFGEDSPLEEDVPPIDSCLHDSSRLGFSFQSITNTAVQCTALIYTNAEGAVGWKEPLSNCSEGTIACYYNLKIDVEDSNITADINSTTSGEVAIVDKLDEIKKINQDLGLGLASIDDSINSQTDKLSSKFDMLATSNTDGSSSIKSSIDSQNENLGIKLDNLDTSLGGKLDGIKSSIDAKEEYSMESESNLEFDDLEVDGMTSGYSADINNQFSTFTSAFDGDLFTLQSIVLPVSPSCGCTDPVINLNMMGHSFNETVEVCSSLDSLFAVMRPLLWFSFLVSLLFGFFRKD